MADKTKHYLVCDQCGRESELLGEDFGGLHYIGYLQNPILAGWRLIVYEMTKTQKRTARKRALEEIEGTYLSPAPFVSRLLNEVCSEKCLKDLKKQRRIRRERIIEVRELGTDPVSDISHKEYREKEMAKQRFSFSTFYR